jgi:hypothetical protein
LQLAGEGVAATFRKPTKLWEGSLLSGLPYVYIRKYLIQSTPGLIVRIIIERDSSFYWSAWWADEPEYCTHCSSRFGAVAKLLKRSNYQAVAVENLCIDVLASSEVHIEMVVSSSVWAE